MAAALAALLLTACAARAESIEFIVDRADGAVYLKNDGATPATIDGYSIESLGDALIVANWTPIAGNYDLGGDQSVDALADWFLLGTPTSSSVAEASPIEDSGSLSPGQIVSLGLFFDTNLLEGLLVTTSAGGETSPIFFADFRDLEADYDGDLEVDEGDLDVFRATYGSTVDLRADGNGDLVVDAADYVFWRNSPEHEFAVPLATAGSTIPEPSAAALLVATLAASSTRRRRR